MPVLRPRSIVALGAALTLSLGIAACGSSDDDAKSASSDDAPLKVGASPVPHAEILDFVKKDLAPKAGLKLDVISYDDYIQPNVALEEGKLDANYFQTVPYLDAQKQDNPSYDDLVSLKPVHLSRSGSTRRRSRTSRRRRTARRSRSRTTPPTRPAASSCSSRPAS